MAETSQPRMAALDRPALGLVLQLTALIALPSQLGVAAMIAVADLTWSWVSAIIALQLVASGLQLATGIAIARRSSARPLFAAYGFASLATAISAMIAFGPDDGGLTLGAGALEIVAGPVMILVAPLVIDVDRLADRRSPADRRPRCSCSR